MKKNLHTIILIDDNEADNFLHQIIIKDTDKSIQIVTFQNAEKALLHLTQQHSSDTPPPALILLDINMPAMNGWEFLEAYKKLDDACKKHIVIVMLTTSPNPDDETKARNNPDVRDFISKPLSSEILEKLVRDYFSTQL